MSQFDFLSFVTIFVFDCCHNLIFKFLSHLVFLGFVTNWIFDFCHILCFWVLSQFELLSSVKILWEKKFSDKFCCHYCPYCHYCHYCHNCHNCHNCHYCHYCRLGSNVGRFKLPFDTLRSLFHKALRRTNRRTDF